jgi:hypothetical protein
MDRLKSYPLVGVKYSLRDEHGEVNFGGTHCRSGLGVRNY